MTVTIRSFRVFRVLGPDDDDEYLIAGRPTGASMSLAVVDEAAEETSEEAPAEEASEREAPEEGDDDDDGEPPPDHSDDDEPEEQGQQEEEEGHEIEYLVEAFGPDDDEHRLARCAGRRHTLRPRSPNLLIRIGIPVRAQDSEDSDEPLRLRFRLRVRSIASESESESEPEWEEPRWYPAEGTMQVREPEEWSSQGQTVPVPSIYEELQKRQTPAPGSGANGLLEHVASQLAALPEFFVGVFDRAPYLPLPGEIGQDGNAATRFENWQRETVEGFSGSYYSYSPRRNMQEIAYNVGYALTGVCNNLVDMIQILRGVEVPYWESDDGGGHGIGFLCSVRSLRKVREIPGISLTEVQLDRDQGTEHLEPPSGAWLHDFRVVPRGWRRRGRQAEHLLCTRSGCGHPSHAHRGTEDDADVAAPRWFNGDRVRDGTAASACCDCTARRPSSGLFHEAFRNWSFRHARPGSIFIYANPALALRKAHINVALRVRRGGDGQVWYQLFDTGATRPPHSDTPARALGVKGKALAEEVWRSRTCEFSDTMQCVAHAFIPPQQGRRLPRIPLYVRVQGTNVGGLKGGIVREDPEVTELPSAPRREDRRWWVPPGRQRDLLLREARRAPVHLAILRRGGGEGTELTVAPAHRRNANRNGNLPSASLVYLSRPMRLGRPLTHLTGSVALQDPAGTDPSAPGPHRQLAQQYEARWVVLLKGSWSEYAECNGTEGRNQKCRNPVVQLYNDDLGIARHHRGNKTYGQAPNGDKFGSRFTHLWDTAMNHFYDRQGQVKPHDEWPSAEWRNTEWDRRLAAQIERGEGFTDDINAGEEATPAPPAAS